MPSPPVLPMPLIPSHTPPPSQYTHLPCTHPPSLYTSQRELVNYMKPNSNRFNILTSLDVPAMYVHVPITPIPANWLKCLYWEGSIPAQVNPWTSMQITSLGSLYIMMVYTASYF